MFDPKLHDSSDEISRQAQDIIESSDFSFLLEDIPNMILIMNSNRQVIYMNRKFSETVKKNINCEPVGKRPGECLMCIHADSGMFGCGSTDFCRVCGFANALEKSEKGKNASGECNITLNHGETLTFSVYTRPFRFRGSNYVFAYMQDISDFKTRQMLENIFLHDINNSITALNGLNELMDDLPPEEVRSIINELSMRLTDEIHSYRLITDAENHMLSVMVSDVNLDELIESIIRSLSNIGSLRRKKIEHRRAGLVIKTDETLLRRVLINTIKNALEASGDDQETVVWTGNNGKLHDIHVRSLPLIPKDVQLQMFQRAFSTKGTGRGWGTYSIRLITEMYLGGKVSFVSDNKNRTIFTVSIPSLQVRV